MRFALRNKAKLIKAFGESYYSLLVHSLEAYAKGRKDINTYNLEGTDYELIDVPSVQPNTDSCFQFVVVGRLYDVVRVAYYSAIG